MQIFLSFLFVFHDSFFCVHMEIGFSYRLKMRRIGDTLLLHGKKRGCRNREIGKGFSLNIERVLFGIEKKKNKTLLND